VAEFRKKRSILSEMEYLTENNGAIQQPINPEYCAGTVETGTMEPLRGIGINEWTERLFR
jgi:hypothetical protein